MKINFSKAQAADIDNFGDDGLFGPDANGTYYYNCVEFGTNTGGMEEVSIQDGCNRYMPICVQDIPDLVTALIEFYNIHAELNTAEQVEKEVLSNTVQGYSNNNKVKYDREPVQSSFTYTF